MPKFSIRVQVLGDKIGLEVSEHGVGWQKPSPTISVSQAQKLQAALADAIEFLNGQEFIEVSIYPEGR